MPFDFFGICSELWLETGCPNGRIVALHRHRAPVRHFDQQVNLGVINGVLEAGLAP